MNHDQIRDRVITQTIDSVARQMTESDPPADLRARVMATLPPRARRPWLRFAVPAAAVGVLALAFVSVTSRNQSSPVVTSRNQSSPVVTSRNQSSPVVTSRDLSSPVVPVVPVVPAGPLDRADVPLPSRLAPLDEVIPLSIEPIQPIGLSIAPITVTPIVTEPLTVPVLDSRAGGRE